MSGRRAKALRRMVYGDMSHRQIREYVVTGKGVRINRPDTLRAIYQGIKRHGLGRVPAKKEG